MPKDDLTPEAKKHLAKVFHDNVPESRRAGLSASCDCGGCSCPPGHGDICDGGTYVGTAGGFYGASSA